MGKNNKPFDYEYVKKCFNNKNYTLISQEYKNSHEKLKYICDYHKDFGEQEVNFVQFRKTKYNCIYCRKENFSIIQYTSKEDMMKLCKMFNVNYKGNYIKDHKSRILYECPKHLGIIQDSDYYNFKKSKFHCSYCASKHLTTEDLINHKNLQSNIIVLSEYKANDKKVKCKCKICNNIWYVTPNHLKNGKGCPKCKLSLGENELKMILDELDIKYIQQYKFENCKNINHLLFDFYLPELNVCIEYQRRTTLSSREVFGKFKL